MSDTSPESRIDHLVFASPDLDRGIAEVESRLGVSPTPGGRHPGFGTRNALVSLGAGCYLEIIGPDPADPGFSGPRPFGIDALSRPALVTWAVREADLEARFASSRARGYDPGNILSGDRRRPDGEILSWRLGIHPGFLSPRGGGVIPFLIDWGTTPHPSHTAAPGCRLVSLEAEHPDPESIEPVLAALEVRLPLRKGSRGLIAAIDGPTGRVELHGGRG